MISAKISEEVNKQIQHELQNAYAYKGVALYFESLNLHGLAAFMFRQDNEEQEHAEKLIRHLVARGEQVKLESMPAAATVYSNPLDAVKTTLAMELETTKRIHNLYKLARQEDDFALQGVLNWFVEEQVEEEEWAGELCELMEKFHANPGQLQMLDHQWGKRVKGE
jgi:ferritin